MSEQHVERRRENDAANWNRQMDRRKADRHEKWRWRALSVWILAFTLMTVYTLNSQKNDRKVARAKFATAIYRDCVHTDVLLTALIKPGIKNTLKLAYYKEHPEERKLVLSQIRDSLKLADSKNCNSLLTNEFRK